MSSGEMRPLHSIRAMKLRQYVTTLNKVVNYDTKLIAKLQVYY
jgi:hypothetical protein